MVASFTYFIDGTARAQTPPTRDAFRQVVEEYVAKRSFAGTVLIARDGDIIFEQAYGEASIEWSVANSLESRYRIGSLSKPFLATLIMRLSELGQLSLDGTLGEYLPELYDGTDASNVTVAQLLSHTSGIKDLPSNFNDPWYQTTARLSYEPRDFAAEWIKPVLVEQPGSAWRYNNAGFILLGIIVEEATGQSYAENLQEHLFGPAKMESSGVFSESAILPRLAQGYARAPNGELMQPLRVDSSIFFSAAGIYSSAHDILAFDQALYREEFLSAEARATMHAKKTDFPYGFGWGVEEWPIGDQRTINVTHHTGSIPGYQSFYIRSEENRDTVIVLNNTNNGSAVIEMGRNLMIMLNNGVAPDVRGRLEDYLSPIAYKGGTDALVAAIRALGDEASNGTLRDFDAREGRLNRLGYKYISDEKLGDAIAVFEWATRLYPKSANTFDSLGEAQRAAGETEKAIASYEKALELDPQSESARTALKELRQ